jgi:hypothetical protein
MPTSRGVMCFNMGITFFEMLTLFCSPFFYDTQRVYQEKNSGKTNLMVLKPGTGAFTEI